MVRITIVGAGGWGMAMANLLAGAGHQITLWKHDSAATPLLSKTRRDNSRLPGITLHPEIRITDNLDLAAAESDSLFLAVPTQGIRETLVKIKSFRNSSRLIVNLAKGLEIGTLCRVSEIVTGVLGENSLPKYVTLSGPSHAEEVARQLPTTVVVAGIDHDTVAEAQRLISTSSFRVYGSNDLIGVELGGALKNIIALAAGMAHGLQLGDNTMGAILTRGLAEITRLGVKMGARPETFAGLSGLGDLVTTCSSKHSRNRLVGERIGRGESLKNISASMTMVAEGVSTTKAALQLAEKLGVEMPITRQVHAVLFEGKPPQEAVAELMTRELKREVYA